MKEKSTMSPKISGLSMAFRPPLIWLLIYFLTTPISLYNYVVCIGLDGHIELETAHGGKCTITLPLYETLHQPETDGHCSCCLKIPIMTTNPNPHCIFSSQEPTAIKTDIVIASWVPPTIFIPRLTGNMLSSPQLYLNSVHIQTAILRL